MKKIFLLLFIILSIFTLGKSTLKTSDVSRILYFEQPSCVNANGIEIAYKTLGDGEPLLMIMGYASTMESWDLEFIKNLASHFQVIIFDNRGIGKTSYNDKKFSIKLFAEDTACLIEALNFEKVNILGWSMGSFIAQELVLKYPEKVDDLILYASDCGGEKAISPTQETIELLEDVQNNPDDFIKILFPEKWINENLLYVQNFKKSIEEAPKNSDSKAAESIIKQQEAISNWAGSYDRLKNIQNNILIITGTDDVVVPPENSFLISNQVPYSWLINIRDGGHGLMFQFPDKLSNIINCFIKNDL